MTDLLAIYKDAILNVCAKCLESCIEACVSPIMHCEYFLREDAGIKLEQQKLNHLRFWANQTTFYFLCCQSQKNFQPTLNRVA